MPAYLRFALMILTSTVVMLGLMYLNTYALTHVFYSETRVYMAVLMGATMAIVMLLWMWGMYENRAANIGILAGAAAVFALSLWLVRSQTTVDGTSYMRAMIPHHSIAIMTSERAGIEDARVARLAEEIAAAQRKEIAEMRYLVAQTATGDTVAEVYEDPSAETGTMEDALSNTLLSALDPAPLTREEAALAITPEGCAFHTSPEIDPILWTGDDGAAMKVNGVIVTLDATGEGTWETDGLRADVTEVDAARSEAALTFAMDPGPASGFRGTWECPA